MRLIVELVDLEVHHRAPTKLTLDYRWILLKVYFGPIKVFCVVKRCLASREASDGADLLHSTAIGEATVLLRHVSISLS